MASKPRGPKTHAPHAASGATTHCRCSFILFHQHTLERPQPLLFGQPQLAQHDVLLRYRSTVLTRLHIAQSQPSVRGLLALLPLLAIHFLSWLGRLPLRGSPPSRRDVRCMSSDSSFSARVGACVLPAHLDVTDAWAAAQHHKHHATPIVLVGIPPHTSPHLRVASV